MKLPSEFEARTLEWMGEETYRALEAALQTEPPVSIRVNRTKWSGEVTGEPVLWASAGVYLSQRPTFYIRSVVSCWLLLCARSVFHVCGTGITHLYYRACGDARFMCCSRWQVYSCAFQFFP